MAEVKRLNLSDFGTVKPKENFIYKPVKKINEEKPKKRSDNDFIEVDFESSIDIKMIDHHIREILHNLEKRYDEKIEELNSIEEYDDMTEEEIMIMELDSHRIMEELEQMQAEIDNFQDYVQTADQILNIYENYLQSLFGNNDINITVKMLAMEFINLAMKFTDKIKIVTNYTSVKKCSCGDVMVTAGKQYMCPTCDAQIDIKIEKNSSGGSKYEYYRSENFEEYFEEYQGRRKTVIPPEVYEKIFTHCNKLSIEPKTLKKKDLLRIMKKYKLSEYYKSINLVSHVVCGTPLPDIQEYKQRFMERHRLVEQEYFKLRDEEGRNNFMSAWFVLKAFLTMEDYHFESDDYLQLAEDALNRQNKFMAKICKNIKERQLTDKSITGNWDFVPIH